mmetsp:Transcript_42746/g.90873  ORF Transcript_42746/g.90873 Transcript_42746/m.90873 type:complete len:217 (-) Transcript_42746:611-1261(-)
MQVKSERPIAPRRRARDLAVVILGRVRERLAAVRTEVSRGHAPELQEARRAVEGLEPLHHDVVIPVRVALDLVVPSRVAARAVDPGGVTSLVGAGYSLRLLLLPLALFVGFVVGGGDVVRGGESLVRRDEDLERLGRVLEDGPDAIGVDVERYFEVGLAEVGGRRRRLQGRVGELQDPHRRDGGGVREGEDGLGQRGSFRLCLLLFRRAGIVVGFS